MRRCALRICADIRAVHSSASDVAGAGVAGASPGLLDFSDTQRVFKDRSTLSLIRSLVVFKLCTVRPLVSNAKRLIDLSNTILGRRITSFAVKHVFFAQFCAGEDAEDIQPTLLQLRQAGIGSILDYAAEADVAAEATATATAGRSGDDAARARLADGDSQSEAELDAHLSLSLRGVRDAGQSAGGFAAVKMTSLAPPELLQRISGILHDHRRAFRRFAAASPSADSALLAGASPAVAALGGEAPYLRIAVSRADFKRLLCGPSLSAEDADDLFTAIDYCGDGTIDYLEWSDFCALMCIGGVEAHAAAAYAIRGASPTDVMRLIAPLTPPGAAGSRADAELTPLEQRRWREVLRRAHALGGAAADAGVSIMVDAEQTYLQPAIDFIVQAMQRQFNRPRAAAQDATPDAAPAASNASSAPSTAPAADGSAPAAPAAEAAAWVPPETAHVLRTAARTLAAVQQRSAAVQSGAAAAMAAAAGTVDLPSSVGAALQPGLLPRAVRSASTRAWPYRLPAHSALFNARTRRPPLVGGVTGAGSEAGGAYPVVYNTFQAYLTDTPARLALTLLRADREGWLFGAKLVRGAYMEQERRLAAQRHYKDPIHADLRATHACYHACADAVLDACAARGAEVMIASHNEDSVRYVVGRLARLGLTPDDSGVSFGQLLGMCDHVSFTLGSHGYRVCKYVPYGPVQEVIPYLLRRAQENSDMLGSAGREINFLKTELRRRLSLRA